MPKTIEIFISYDSRDRDYVKELVTIMESLGLKARIDFHLPYGANFYRYMETALKECFVALLVISEHYVENESWARTELMDLISWHVKGRTLIIPLLIDEIQQDLLPFGIQTVRHISNIGRDFEQLRGQIRILRDQLVSMGIKARDTNTCLGKIPIELKEISERRIRVQMTDVCNFTPVNSCPWCHWDEFDKENITRQPQRLLSVLGRLKEEAHLNNIFPRPRMDFTLTGGEPLSDMTYLPQFLSLCSKDSFVITNGYYLVRSLKILRESNVDNIRISYQPRVRDDNTNMQIVEGIESLLKETQMNIRFNHVLQSASNDVEQNSLEIDNFITHIQNKFGTYIGNRIKGIAFIEPFYTTDPPNGCTEKFDVFRFGEVWAKRHDLLPKKLSPFLSRKRVYKYQNLDIEFVKVNCDYTEDYIWRCLSCALEKDICLAADGRIRICSGWDMVNLKPKFIYAHYSESSPLKSISGAIKREYGTVAFYTHFPLWAHLIHGGNLSDVTKEFIKQCQLDKPEVKELLERADPGLMFAPDDFKTWNILYKIAELVMRENGPFVRIYHEGICPSDKHSESIKLCAHLLKSAYQLALELAINKDHDVYRPAFLISLLLLEYLSVDESMFSTGRTVLAQGISTELLKAFVQRKRLSDGMCSDAIYCLGAIGMENTDTSSVEKFVNSLSRPPQIQSAAQIQYLLGCIYRQEGKNDSAAKAFKSCSSLARRGIDNPRNRLSLFEWLYPELEAEANRSLGTVLKTSEATRKQSLEAFETADLLSIIYDTKLRYTALFSDGYAAMCRYFEEKSEENKREALRNFSDSMALNPDFYACLIRMAIFELELSLLNNTKILKEKATKRLQHARDIFSNRGLLTDQEYLNSLLCEYSIAISDYINITVEALPDPGLAGIKLCRRIGKKDLECVINDAKFLLNIIWKEPGDRLDKLRSILNDFIVKCNQLLSDL